MGRRSGAGISQLRHADCRGPELILFHGGTGSWTHWIRNIPALRDHFTVHAYDLPGNGDSPSVPGDITPHDYVDIVCESIRAVGGATQPVFLCGFSFGGVVATMLTARMPEKVSRLAVVAPGGLRSAPSAGSGRSRHDLRKMPPEPVPEDERRAILRHNFGFSRGAGRVSSWALWKRFNAASSRWTIFTA